MRGKGTRKKIKNIAEAFRSGQTQRLHKKNKLLALPKDRA